MHYIRGFDVARLGSDSSEVSIRPEQVFIGLNLLIGDSTVILFASHRHDELYGPRSTHARQLDKEQGIDGSET